LFSLLGGASYLIPVPFVDDWTLNLVRRRMYGYILEGSRLQIDQRGLKVLTAGQRDWALGKGCAYLLFLPLTVTLYVVGRYFRKIFFILGLKSAADQAVSVFAEGHAVRYLIGTGMVTQTTLSSADLQVRVYEAVSSALAEADPRFIRTSMRRLFRGRREELRQAAEVLVEAGQAHKRQRGRADDVEVDLTKGESLLDRMQDSVVNIFAADTAFLRHLESRIDFHLGGGARKCAEPRTTRTA